MKRTFVHIEDGHKKFWTVIVVGRCHVECTWGRIGTNGQSRIFYFDNGGAGRYAARKVAEKLSKGYAEIS